MGLRGCVSGLAILGAAICAAQASSAAGQDGAISSSPTPPARPVITTTASTQGSAMLLPASAAAALAPELLSPSASLSPKARPAIAAPGAAPVAAAPAAKLVPAVAVVPAEPAPRGKLSRKEAAAQARAQADARRFAEVSRDELKKAVYTVKQDMGSSRGRIWCVPFARAVTGIDIRGDAGTWWKNAGDRYARGPAPKTGAVLNFRSTRSMPKGHVAVVSRVVNSRTILVDQANWVKNRVTTDTAVIDVSPRNDWSAVRVANQHDSYGDVYPTFGFIYQGPSEDG